MKRLIGLLTLMLTAATTASFAQNTPAATISGRVTRDGGLPAVGYYVTARSTTYVSPAPAAEAITDAQGNYVIHIATGFAPSLFVGTPAAPADTHFSVTVTAPKSLFVAPSKQDVTLTNDQAARNINFHLTTGPQISVHVENVQTDQPIAGVPVQYRTEFGMEQPAGITDAKGVLTFRVHDLNIFLTIPPSPALNLNPLPGESFYKSVTLTPLQKFVWNVNAYPTSAFSKPQIMGTVLDASGKPAAHAIVTVFIQSNQVSTVETDDQGKFIAPVWNLNSESMSDASGFIRASKGHEGSGQTITLLDALHGMTIALRKHYLASVSGVLVNPHGKPVPGRWVSAGLLAGSGLTGAVTDAAGQFTIHRIWPGDNCLLQIVGATDNSGFVRLPLKLKPGQEQDLGKIVAPDTNRTLAGQVINTKGQIIHKQLEVTATGPHTGAIVQTDSSGNFQFSHLVPERLVLKVFYPPAPGRRDYNLTENSPDLACQTQVVPNGQTLRLIATNPPPPPAPAMPTAPTLTLPAPPNAPPQIIQGQSFSDINGMLLQVGPLGTFGSPVAPRYMSLCASVNIGWQYFSEGPLWAGTVDALNGMRYFVKDGTAILIDRHGRVLYSTSIPRPTGYRIDIFSMPGNHSNITIHDPAGKFLTQFSVPEPNPYAVVQKNKLIITAADHQVFWQSQTESSPIKFYIVESDHGQVFSYGSEGSLIANGDVRFSVAQHRTVFKDGKGHIFFDGPLTSIITKVTTLHDTVPMSSLPSCILPVTVSNAPEVVKYQVYNRQGKVIATGDWVTHYR